MSRRYIKPNDEALTRQSIEKLLETELKIKSKVTIAKESAKKKVDSAKNKIDSYKETILKQAKDEREVKLAESIAAAQSKSQKRIKQAEIESKQFENAGSDLIDKAVKEITAIILGNGENGKL